MLHEFEGFLEHLGDAVFDIAGQILCHVVAEVGDTDGLGDIADVVRVPDGHGG